MKILHLTPSYKPAIIYGGPTVSASELCEAQQALGHSLVVLTTLANGKAELSFPSGTLQLIEEVPVFFFKRLTKDHSHFSHFLLLRLWVLSPRYQVIHIHSWWNLVAVLGTMLCLIRGHQPAISVRGMLGDFSFNSNLKLIFHYFIGKRVLKRCVLHATSQKEQKDIEKRVPGAVVFTLPNIIDLPATVLPVYQAIEQTNEFKLVFIGRLHPIKGLDLLFQALSRVNFPWHLSIAGEGESVYVKTLKELALELGMASQISWLGWQSGPEKEQLLQQSDLLVLTSRHENFANVVVEALALGTPVLVSDQVGLSDYVQMHGLGRVCSLDPEDIAEKLADLQADIESRAHIRNTAPDLIRRDFDPQMLARKYVEAYSKYL